MMVCHQIIAEEYMLSFITDIIFEHFIVVPSWLIPFPEYTIQKIRDFIAFHIHIFINRMAKKLYIKLPFKNIIG